MIQFSHDRSAIPLRDLIHLFARGANWKMPLALEAWRDLLRHSPMVVTAWNGEQLVGFARLLTDFVRWANLYDVVVDPSIRRQGIGSQLVQRLVGHPRVARVRTIWLGTAEAHSFYERFGFVRDGSGHGMLLVRRNRDDELGVGSQLANAASVEHQDQRSQRPSFIISTSEVAEEPGQYAGTTEILSHGRPIGVAAGLQRLGLHVERLPAGHRTSFPHAHEEEEEFVCVLDGEVDAWIDGTLQRMVTGDLAAFPAGTGVAHTIVNNTDGEAVLLVGGERSVGKSRIFYPLNPERQTRLKERWWNDVPRGRIGACPPHARAQREAAPILETRRLALRWWQISDAEAMFEIFSDLAVHRYSGATPLVDVAAARDWLEREVVAAPARGFGHWAIVEKDSHEVVGSCGFRAGFETGELELGFTVARTHWNQGYATEVAAACCEYGTERMRATKVLALTMPENAAARRVLEKIGLALRGIEQHDGVQWCVYQTAPPAPLT